MSMNHYLTRVQVRELCGMVVPVWFAADTPAEQIRALLGATLADVESCVEPGRLVLVVDGAPHAEPAVRDLCAEFARRAGAPFQVRVLPKNQGKGAALLAGMDLLPAGLFVVFRDADGDHFTDDVPHLVRLAHQMAAENDGSPVMVIGRRTAVHPPLGWVRGEYELLLNEITLDALRYALAREGRALPLTYCHHDLPPDFQSGYKLYSPAAARIAAEGLRRAAAARPELEMLRWGMELVPLVEVSLAGGVFGEVHRMTFHDQPVTAYGSMDRPRAYGRKTAWLLSRCGVAPAAARQMLDNALVRRALDTDPAGHQELLAYRRQVLDALGAPDAPVRAPLFL